VVGKPVPRLELWSGDQAFGKFEVVADIEEFDPVFVVFGEF
jgi:hypothetical protein